MAFKSQLDNDLKTALLGGDRFSAQVLRGLKAAILNEEVAKGKRDTGLDDASIEQLIAKEVKKRHDSVEQYTAAGRPELADAERKEAELLSGYLPAQLSEDEIAAVVDAVIAKFSAADPQAIGPKAMGQVMGAVKSQLGASADGAVIARLVTSKLVA